MPNIHRLRQYNNGKSGELLTRSIMVQICFNFKHSLSLQTECVRRGYALQASSVKSAIQPPVGYYFNDELFHNYPPPVDMGIDQDGLAELRGRAAGTKKRGQNTQHRAG